MLITSVENPVVKMAAKLSASKKERAQQGLFVIEGLRLCLDALRSGVRCRYVFLSTEACARLYNSIKPMLAENARVYEVSESVLAKMSDTKHPQGVLCVCELIDRCRPVSAMEPTGRYIGLEQIQDPGNLGAIIRTAEALGLSGVLLGGDCCDIYNPKVIRATMGGVFRLPVYTTENPAASCRTLAQMGLCTVAAVPHVDATPITQRRFAPGCVAFVGNEARGLTDALIAACDARVTIPMPGRAESLNAAMAAGILMWEMTRAQEEGGAL